MELQDVEGDDCSLSCFLSLLMKWRFENRIQKQMDSLKKVRVCHCHILVEMAYEVYILLRDLMTSSARNY